jgi:HSP20 family protein
MVSQVKMQAAGEQDEFLELPRSLTHAGGPAPLIDAFEIDGMVEMIAEVPGVPESAIDVTLDGDVLTIEIDKGNNSQAKRVYFSERVFGRFRRSIQMPFAPEPDKVHAALYNGLLTIRFPRVEQRRMHRIAVRGAPEPRGQRSAIGSSWPERPGTPTEPLTLDVKATPTPPVRDR